MLSSLHQNKIETAIYIYISIYIYMYMYKHMHIYIPLHIYVYIHMYMFVCVCIYGGGKKTPVIRVHNNYFSGAGVRKPPSVQLLLGNHCKSE